MPECLQDGKLGQKKKKKKIYQSKKKKKQTNTRAVDAKGNMNSVGIIVISKCWRDRQAGYISTCFESHNHDDVIMKQNNERHNSEAQEVDENMKLQS